MIENDAQLNAILIKDFEDIVNTVTDQIFKKLRESIEDVVYGAGIPTTYSRYKDDGGLLGSFDESQIKITGNIIEKSIDQNHLEMVRHVSGDKSDFTHGSEYFGDVDDVREFLTDWIINGDSGPLFGTGFWREPRNFWKPIMDLFEDGSINRMVEGMMSAKGMKWIKV